MNTIENYYNASADVLVQPGSVVGLKYKETAKPVELKENTLIRSGTIIYGDVQCGAYFQTGHNALIRENTKIGKHVVIGSNTVIDGNVEIGDFVKIESNCYIPTHTSIGSRVFMGPNVTITNDKYPLKERNNYIPLGPTIEDGVTIGGGCVIVPGVIIGEGSFIAAGAVVTKDIPPFSLVKGIPGKIFPLPDKLQEKNMALSWRQFLPA